MYLGYAEVYLGYAEKCIYMVLCTRTEYQIEWPFCTEY